MISGSMEHALLVLAPDLSHVVGLIVGWSPAIVYAALVVVLSAVYPAYCSQTADEGAAADYDDDDDGSVT